MTRWFRRSTRSRSSGGASAGSGATPPPSDFVFSNTLPGRLFLLTSILWVAVLTAGAFTDVPPIVEVFRKVVSISWFISIGWLAVLFFAHNRRRFLWRVRQKLILSYIFLGFVPVLLIAALALVGALALYVNLAAYMFHEGFADIQQDVLQAAETTAAEISRTGVEAEAVIRKYENQASRYPNLSLAVIDVSQALDRDTPASARPSVTAGEWRHAQPPARTPQWLGKLGGDFSSAIAVSLNEAETEWRLVIRAVKPIRDGRRAVLVDLPVDPHTIADIDERTKTRIGPISVPIECGGFDGSTGGSELVSGTTVFRKTVAFVACTDWRSGVPGLVSVGLDAPFDRLYRRVAQLQIGGPQTFVMIFVVVGVLFILIQGAALVMGALLARSITYAVHELFVGTERIQQGDFAHRIKIESGDQLGDLANSFNRMSSSIEHLLHVQREKQRLDDELRIAHDIQKSLLPTSPPSVPGLSIADLCEPAREVGGDYYDFFDLGPRRLGVMVADVSGKGTSAALYMAELKGLMLALYRKEQSPRRLLIEANRLLSEHLDNRSFITMTYAVIDLEARTVTYARAGHTPLIFVSGDRHDVVIPSGMVLGLRLPGAAARFDQLLEEQTRPIAPGDVIVLYTDGISEAMDEDDNLFSDEALAAVVAGQRDQDAAGIRERVAREVRSFVGNAEPHDDMTLIVLKVGAL